MANVQACDSCGAAGATHQRGRLRSRDYCDVCVELADLYLAAVDAAHTAAAVYFDEKRASAAEESGLKVLPV